MFEVKVCAAHVTPLSLMFDAASETAAVIPEEQVVPVTVPFAQ
jgi:hypothetical protein